MRVIIALAISVLCVSGMHTLAQSDIPALQDPTRPKTYSASAENTTTSRPRNNYALSYVSVKDTPVAVVNGQRVRRGDRVDGARVLAITAQGVRLATQAGERLLRIHSQPSIKTIRP